MLWYSYSLSGSSVLNKLHAMQETRVRSLGSEDPLEKEMATHSSIFAWEVPWTEEPGRLQSTGSLSVRHDLATKQQQLYQGKSVFYEFFIISGCWIFIKCSFCIDFFFHSINLVKNMGCFSNVKLTIPRKNPAWWLGHELQDLIC